MKLNNYDKIAPYYDRLSRMVFFNSQRDVQKYQLHFITEGQKILIVGGGSGWILEQFGKFFHQLSITYVEISANMLSMARKRNCGNNTVRFVHAAAEEFESEEVYDVVITAFLFDNFGKVRANEVFLKLDAFLKPDGKWLFSDFFLDNKKPQIWQRLMLRMMYLFFRQISSVEANQLTDMHPLFLSKQYVTVDTKRYYSGFIKGIIYRKS